MLAGPITGLIVRVAGWRPDGPAGLETSSCPTLSAQPASILLHADSSSAHPRAARPDGVRVSPSTSCRRCSATLGSARRSTSTATSCQPSSTMRWQRRGRPS